MSNAGKSAVELSVIIACFNGGDTLASQLEALASQKWHKEWEVIFADNGSTDNSRQVAESFQAKLPNLRIIDAGGKRGVAHARNVAIQCAKSDRFAFCDADDQVGHGWVSSIGDALGEFDVVVSQFDDQKLNQQWFRDLWNTSTDGPKPVLKFLPAVAGYGLGFTRRVYERVGPFDESMPRMSDIDYTWRVQLAGFKLDFLPHAVVHYRHRVSLKEIFVRGYRDGQAQVQLYKKYREHGMPWKSWWRGVKLWIWMILRLPQLCTRKGRWTWVIKAGFMLGRLRGSIKYGVVAL
jgi:glycosyltransferase involved in cell wall biosynthesis